VELQTRFRADLEKPTDLKNRDVEGVLKRMFDSYAGMVRSSVCLINQQFLDNDKPLPPPRDGLLYVRMLSPLESSSSDDGFSQLVEKSQHTASGRLAFRSDVVGRAYLHAKASVGFSLQV
jgi:Odorant response abnormal 4-like